MNKALLTGPWLVLAVVGLVSLIGMIPLAGARQQSEGSGSYLLGPDRPTVFTFDRDSMSCAVSWGTLVAPGPGPITDPKMKLERVNFGMVVYSLNVTSFKAINNRVTMIGQARSITTVNEKIVENAVYQFKVEAVDGGPAAQDTFSMALEGKGLMFDGHKFEPAVGAGLVGGDVVIHP